MLSEKTKRSGTATPASSGYPKVKKESSSSEYDYFYNEKAVGIKMILVLIACVVFSAIFFLGCWKLVLWVLTHVFEVQL